MLRYQGAVDSFNYRPRLKITELFHSLQGEGRHSGLPCSFIRLTGCALRCTYCDTPYAFYGGSWSSFEELEAFVTKKGSPLVQITGGEPLHQKAVWPFVDGLVDKGFKPLIETGGAVDIAGLNPKTHVVLDLKTPASGELEKMLWGNLEHLKPSDEVKFVVCSVDDLEWSLRQVREHQLDTRFGVLISPVAEADNAAEMAEMVVGCGLNIRFQVQLHKVLWGDQKGR